MFSSVSIAYTPSTADEVEIRAVARLDQKRVVDLEIVYYDADTEPVSLWRITLQQKNLRRTSGMSEQDDLEHILKMAFPALDPAHRAERMLADALQQSTTIPETGTEVYLRYTAYSAAVVVRTAAGGESVIEALELVFDNDANVLPISNTIGKWEAAFSARPVGV